MADVHQVPCPTCEHPNPADAKFCTDCGARVDNAPPQLGPSLSRVPLRAERRQLTLMFCDMVGSARIATQYDPEDLSTILRRYQAVVGACIQPFGGYIARYMGDGLLIYFGWPQSHEANAERAVRAALAITAAVGSVTANGLPLRVRIGIASGIVVVGELLAANAAREHAVVGEAPNIASRLKGFALPDTIVIDEATKARIGDLFDCADLGTLEIRGYSDPLQAWQVQGESQIQGRFEALRASKLAALVDRTEEMALLVRQWNEVEHAGGRAVILCGEPGIGKSRLIAALKENLGSSDHTCLSCFCAPHHHDDALHPIIAHLEHAAGFRREDTPQTKLGKLKSLIATNGATPDAVALLTNLLSLPTDGLPTLSLTPQRRKEKTFEALHDQLARLARHRRVLVVLEDAQWSDPTTLELIGQVIDRMAHLRVLLVVTSRPEWRAPWTDRTNVTLVPVGPLDRKHSATLIRQLVNSDDSIGEIIDRIVTETDGVPLYIEELTKAVFEELAHAIREGTSAGTPLKVPASLRDSLMARLDRLPTARDVAQIGAVIGREFSHGLIAEVARMPESTLLLGLEQLVGANLLYRRGVPPDADYEFKHALMQDIAYETLLRSHCRDIHADIVRALEKRAVDTNASQPGLLAHHCVQAGLIEQAAVYYREAGERAAERAALEETLSYLGRGLSLLHALPEGPMRLMLEVELKLALGRVLLSLRGSADIDAGNAFADAVETSRGLDRLELFTRALWGYWFNRAHRQDPSADKHAAQDLLERGSERGNQPAQIVAHTMLGVTLLWQGRFPSARSQFQSALGLCKSGAHRTLDLAIVSNHLDDHIRGQLALTLACLGHIEHGSAEATLVMRNAMVLPHLPLRAILIGVKCRHDWFVGDIEELQETATALVSLSESQGFPFYLTVGRCHLGWLAAKSGRLAEGIDLLQAGLSDLQSAQATIWEPYFLGMVAEAQGWAGNVDEADRLLEQALNVSLATGGVWFDAELHRRKGEVALIRSAAATAVAEASFQRSLAIARGGSAKLWELRSAISLARMWSTMGKREEARELLATIYGWFSEGHRASDMKIAAGLLAELGRDPDTPAGPG